MPTPADVIPKRDLRYREGGSTPRSIRFNDALWEAFRERALTLGWPPLEALRWLMEDFANGVISAPSPESQGVEAVGEHHPDDGGADIEPSAGGV
jgi:hypothetical protein